MCNRTDLVGIIPGVGPVAQEGLERLGIKTLGDLLQWYPRQYLDASHPTLVSRVPYNQISSVEVIIDSFQVKPTKNRRLSMVDVLAHDASGEITGRWFHQPYLRQKLVPGSKWIWIGMVSRFRGQTVMMSPLIEDQPMILAIYGQTKGITSKMLRRYQDWALQNVDFSKDSLPLEIQKERKLLPDRDLFKRLHQPEKIEETEAARSQIAFTEVFQFFAQMLLSKRGEKQEEGIGIPLDIDLIKKLISDLPFILTTGQKRVLWVCLQELETGQPMTRLLNGDVGSGKTVVAALLAATVAKAGYQTVLIAPTEILAKQHEESIKKILKLTQINVALWTAAQKDSLDADIIIGTHAVLQPGFSVPKLALVIVDEQHRFGVKQRHVLRQQSSPPHLLSMTATPIPRTLALALYGDLTVSFLKEKPKDRLPIETVLVRPEHRSKMYEKVQDEIAAGHQVFIICSLIEEKEKKEEVGESVGFEQRTLEQEEVQERKTVLAEVTRLKKEFPQFGVIEAIHGKMKAADKRKIMERMAAGEINVLVATSVIETGVDIPGATVMIIEGAEHFGLAQLHQFRGRVGRSNQQSYCFLCPLKISPSSQKRLDVLVNSNDGFEIAEKDLELRGPGELIGKIQSGLPDFRMASLSNTHFLLEIKELVESFDRKNPGKLQKYSEETYSNGMGGLE